jgi:hypothetical protein
MDRPAGGPSAWQVEAGAAAGWPPLDTHPAPRDADLAPGAYLPTLKEDA